MSVLDRLHGSVVFPRRVDVLVRHLAHVVPQGATVLDVGAGDGLVAASLLKRRPDLTVSAIDVLVRPDTHVPVQEFDGRTIPYTDGAFDAALLIDVVHHADDPEALLEDSSRVASRCLVVKDHLAEGVLAGPTLRFMDWVGNARHGVSLPHAYWPRQEWQDAFERLGLDVEVWIGALGLYPAPAGLLFDRSLHFIARLGKRAS